MRDGEPYGEALTASGDNLTVTWKDLPAYHDGGVAHVYTVSEDPVASYTTAIAGNAEEGFTVTNTFNAFVDVTAVKTWVDTAGNELEASPTVITLHLMKRVGENGAVAVPDGVATIPAGASGDELAVTWKNLHTVENGLAVTYFVQEDPVENTQVSYAEGAMVDGVLVLGVTNTLHTPVPVQTGYVSFVDPLNEEGSQVLVFKSVYGGDSFDTLKPATDPKHDGHSFQQWDRNESIADDGTVLTTYVARYQDTSEKPITVSYVNGQADSGKELVKSELTTDPSKVTPPPDPTHEGCEFVKWVRLEDAGGNIIYVAQFTPACEPEPTPKPGHVYMDPPVMKHVTGSPSTYPTFTFRMEAVTKGAPMPEGSTGAVKTITLNGPGSAEFGWIDYTAAGTYEYRITEDTVTVDNWTSDTAEYNLTAVVTDDGKGNLSLTRSYTKNGIAVTTAEAVFTNVYTTPVDPVNPDNPVTPTPGRSDPIPQKGSTLVATGDNTPLEWAAIIAGLALIALLAAALARCRSK